MFSCFSIHVQHISPSPERRQDSSKVDSPALYVYRALDDSEPPTALVIFNDNDTHTPGAIDELIACAGLVLSSAQDAPVTTSRYTHIGTWTASPGTTRLVCHDSEDDNPVAPILLWVAFDVASEDDDDFNRWYTEEHMTLVARIPGWQRGRRYKKLASASDTTATTTTYLALQEFSTADFEKTEEIRHARGTDWSKRIFGKVRDRRVGTFELVRVVDG
ncbi:hypothetical protein C8F01DRAFT_1376650 [Mycena amicta]|nr:hypothetical protein C8F01DRAFT_1376650 [Mycena amicta]